MHHQCSLEKAGYPWTEVDGRTQERDGAPPVEASRQNYPILKERERLGAL